ncbi:MAG: hypothetical protein HY815_24305 [Candidatus Riflebacteria bacterium]|nr:hypothetical protein [Candidatus Riflebacteria bacterium]
MKRLQRKWAIAPVMVAVGILLAGCSDSNVPMGNASTKGYPASVTVLVSPTTQTAGGQIAVIAMVKDYMGNPVPDGFKVTFTSECDTAGVTGPNEGTTSKGQAVSTISIPTSVTQDINCTVTAIAGEVSGSGAFAVKAGSSSGTSTSQAATTLSTIQVQLSATSVPADGTSQVKVTATLRNSSGTTDNLNGKEITFSVDSGVLLSPTGTAVRSVTLTTDGNAQQTVTFVSPTTPGVATISITSLGLSTVRTVSSYGSPAIIVLAEDVGTNPNPSQIYVTGSGRQENSTIYFKVLDKNGSSVQLNATRTVEFMILNGGLFGGESLSPGMGVGSFIANGVVKTVLRAGTRAGTVKIIAFIQNPTVANGVTLEASDLATTAGSPTVTSAKLATVTSSLAGQRLKILFGADQGSYVISSNAAGSITLAQNMTATSSTLPYRVDDGRLDFNLEPYTNAIEIAIAGDLPSGENFSVVPTILNIRGLLVAHLEDQITAFLADRFSNPVPQATSVSFNIFDEANFGPVGLIFGSGTTPAITASGWSAVTASLRSQPPNPSTGVARVQAQTQSANTAKVKSLYIDQTSNVLYAGTDGGGIFRTQNPTQDVSAATPTSPTGVRWVHAGRGNTGLFNGYVTRIVQDAAAAGNPVAADPSVLWAATNYGVFKTNSSGEIWEDASAREMVYGDNATVHFFCNSTVAPGTNRTACAPPIVRGIDADVTLTFASNMRRAKTKVRINSRLTDEYVYINSRLIRLYNIPPGVLDYAATPTITVDYEKADSLPWNVPVKALALNPNTVLAGGTFDTRILYAGLAGQGVWRSTNGGLSWTQESTGLTNSKVTALAYDAANNYLFVGTQGGGVFRATDDRLVAGHGTLTFAAINGTGATSLLFKQINALQVSPTGEVVVGTVLGGVWVGTQTAAGPPPVYAWQAANPNIQDPAVSQLRVNTTVTDLVIAGAASPYTVYASAIDDDDPQNTLGGVFQGVLTSGAPPTLVFTATAVFSDTVASLSNKFVQCLAYDATNNRLYAGTDGRNVFRLDLASPTQWWQINDPQGYLPNAADQSLPSAITNVIYNTAPVVFSGSPIINVVQVSDSTRTVVSSTPGPAIQLRGAISDIPHGGSQTFEYTVSDLNGNPLVSGSQITVTASAGTLAGHINVADRRGGDLDLGVGWVEDQPVHHHGQRGRRPRLLEHRSCLPQPTPTCRQPGRHHGDQRELRRPAPARSRDVRRLVDRLLRHVQDRHVFVRDDRSVETAWPPSTLTRRGPPRAPLVCLRTFGTPTRPSASSTDRAGSPWISGFQVFARNVLDDEGTQRVRPAKGRPGGEYPVVHRGAG